MNNIIPSPEYPVLGWWSGGLASATACKKAQEKYGHENVIFIMIGTLDNEHEDTYRFKLDCEKWYKKEIITIQSKKYETIQDVWYGCLGLNFATGAKCSSDLKREVRQDYIKRQPFSYQVFGFDKSEKKRIKGMDKNNYHLNPVYPISEMTKNECLKFVNDAGILEPEPYRLGYRNNNCFKTGCVQGGIGYWQKIGRDFPDKFNTMAALEHELTDLKGQPVYILSDQSDNQKRPVFLKPHPKYPEIKHIAQMKGRAVEPLSDCNGFCGKHEVNNN